MDNGRNLLIYLAIKHDGDYYSLMKALEERDYSDYQEASRVVNSLDCQVLTMLDNDYPRYLRQLPYAPLVLFYRGDISLINDSSQKTNLAIIGTREPSEYGIRATKEIASRVCFEVNVVSGLARGIDGVAQQMVVDSGGKTIAVLGSGLNNIYPLRHNKLAKEILENGGLLIGEYPPNSVPKNSNFPSRNRLIAAFSSAVLITEAYEKSGTSITAFFASEVGKPVLCIPYPITVKNSFCNLLIYEGALLARNADDVLDVLLVRHKII